MTPPPKLASTSPVFRSNLKIGSTGLLSQLTGVPAPNVPAPQRSYAQMCPSIGAMSIPAVEPHSRPSGSVPQFAVTVGAGFGSPSPVIGLPVGIAGGSAVASGASDSDAQPASRNTVQTNNTDFTARNDDMATSLPYDNALCRFGSILSDTRLPRALGSRTLGEPAGSQVVRSLDPTPFARPGQSRFRRPGAWTRMPEAEVRQMQPWRVGPAMPIGDPVLCQNSTERHH